MKAIFLLSFFAIFFFSAVKAQVPPSSRATATDTRANTLQQQFNSLKYRSSTHTEFNQDYKVVKLRSLDGLWKNIQDTLRARNLKIKQARKGIEQELVQAQKVIQTQEQQLKFLKQENAQKEQAVQRSAHDIASISFLGLDMNKQTFAILSWAIIFILLIGLGIVFFLYKNSKTVTDEKVKAYQDIDQEFKTHKQNARDRELKIKRELQTELNRVEDLNQQIALLKKQTQV